MDRNDLAELPARGAAGPAGDVLDEIEFARMGVRVRLGAHPAQDLLRIGQEGEDGGGRRGDPSSRRTTSDLSMGFSLK